MARIPSRWWHSLARTALTCAAAALLLALVARGALAHGALRDARPGSGDHLSVAPREIRLRFTEPVALPVARVALLGPDGSPVVLGAPVSPADSASVLVAQIRGPLEAGRYTVRWQIAGADGHPVRGEYAFVIAPGASGLAPPAAAPAAAAAESHHDPVSLPTGSTFDAASPLYVLVRWVTFVGVVGAVGAVAFRLVVLRSPGRLPGGAGAALAGPAGRASARIGLAAAVLLAAATAARLLAQSVALHGADEALRPALVGALLARTTWGWGWLLQAAGTAAALAGFARARRDDARGWWVATAGALALSASPALSGHAAAAERLAPLAVAADALHVLGAGGWLGSLLLVVAVGIPLVARLERDARAPALAALVDAFSPAALLFAGIVVATGVFGAWLHLGSLAALAEGAYGRTLLLKLALFGAVAAAGGYNWLRVRPALAREPAAERLRRVALAELAFAALVLAVTAVLVALPMDAGAVAGR